MGTADVRAIQEQQVKMVVEIQRTAEALDKGDRAGMGRFVGLPCFLDQMYGDDAADNAQHLPHDPWPAGE